MSDAETASISRCPDLAVESERVRLIDEAVAAWGQLDVLVNNAGINLTGEILLSDGGLNLT